MWKLARAAASFRARVRPGGRNPRDAKAASTDTSPHLRRLRTRELQLSLLPTVCCAGVEPKCSETPAHVRQACWPRSVRSPWTTPTASSVGMTPEPWPTLPPEPKTPRPSSSCTPHFHRRSSTPLTHMSTAPRPRALATHWRSFASYFRSPLRLIVPRMDTELTRNGSGTSNHPGCAEPSGSTSGLAV